MYQTIERKVYSMSDMFGNIGGMDSVLWIFTSFFVGLFSSKIYMLSLVSSFYNTIVNKDTSQLIKSNIVLHEEVKQSHHQRINTQKSFSDNFDNLSKDEKLWDELDKSSNLFISQNTNKNTNSYIKDKCI